MLNRVGYSPEISHGVLVEMAEHRKDLEKKTKPILAQFVWLGKSLLNNKKDVLCIAVGVSLRKVSIF